MCLKSLSLRIRNIYVKRNDCVLIIDCHDTKLNPTRKGIERNLRRENGRRIT